MDALLNFDDSAKDLAKQLYISRAALYRHISSLNEKTGTKSRIGLIQFYYQQKMKNEIMRDCIFYKKRYNNRKRERKWRKENETDYYNGTSADSA